MKTVLIIKTSSLGDVIHTLPALTDAQSVLGDVQFDWVVEENFAEIPSWHPTVRHIFPVAIRRWRKNIFQTLFNRDGKGEWKKFKQQLQQTQYDYIIDAQGLLKSAWLTRFARGETYGLDKQSAREAIASHFYQHPQSVAKQQHAVERVRELFAKSLGYSCNDLPLDYGISVHMAQHQKISANDTDKQVLFLHGTTWETKHWPEQYWFELANRVTEMGYQIVIPWGNEQEHERALRIQKQSGRAKQVRVLDKMNLNDLAKQINSVTAVVAVDTGLAHLSAALEKPTIAIYGPTSPGLTGSYGNNQSHLKVDYDCSPCFKKTCDKHKDNIYPACYTSLTPDKVMNSLNQLLKG